MLEGLSKHQEKQVRALNVELGVHALGLYGLGSLMYQVGTPEVVAIGTTLGLSGIAFSAWIRKRWAMESIDGEI